MGTSEVASFFVGLVLGVIQTGAYQHRTFTVYEGKPLQTVVLSAAISSAYWFSTYFVVAHNYAGFIGFSLGTMLITTLMSYKAKLKREKTCGDSSP